MARRWILTLTALLALAAWTAPPRATAEIRPLAGGTVQGRVEFEEVRGGVRVRALVRGLKPNARHGFHVHERGDCADAGPHFNPDGSRHGGPRSKVRHAGDLGNLESDAKGEARYDLVIPGVTLKPGERCILGRSVIVHADEDDLVTDPAGNSGARVACGAIR